MVKTFEDLDVEFDIPIRDRRKYSFLMNWIYLNRFQNSKNIQQNIFTKISTGLVCEAKVLKHVYSTLRKCASVEAENKWVDSFDILEEVEWNDVHSANFNCTIETQLRSFYLNYLIG